MWIEPKTSQHILVMIKRFFGISVTKEKVLYHEYNLVLNLIFLVVLEMSDWPTPTKWSLHIVMSTNEQKSLKDHLSDWCFKWVSGLLSQYAHYMSYPLVNRRGQRVSCCFGALGKWLTYSHNLVIICFMSTSVQQKRSKS